MQIVFNPPADAHMMGCPLILAVECIYIYILIFADVYWPAPDTHAGRARGQRRLVALTQRAGHFHVGFLAPALGFCLGAPPKRTILCRLA